MKCARIFPPIFELSSFDHNFPKIVAAPINGNANYLVHLKGQWLPKKVLKLHQNQPINRDTIVAETMSSSHEECSGLGAWQTKKTKIVTNTIFSHLQPAHVVRSSPNFACWYSLSRPLKRLQSFFDPMHSFSYRVHRKFRGKWQTSIFSGISL